MNTDKAECPTCRKRFGRRKLEPSEALAREASRRFPAAYARRAKGEDTDVFEGDCGGEAGAELHALAPEPGEVLRELQRTEEEYLAQRRCQDADEESERLAKMLQEEVS